MLQSLGVQRSVEGTLLTSYKHRAISEPQSKYATIKIRRNSSTLPLPGAGRGPGRWGPAPAPCRAGPWLGTVHGWSASRRGDGGGTCCVFSVSRPTLRVEDLGEKRLFRYFFLFRVAQTPQIPPLPAPKD